MKPELAAEVVDAEFEELGSLGAYNGTDCLVLFSADDDQAVDFAMARPVGRVSVIRVRVSQATPVKSGAFAVGGRVFRVISEPLRPDSHRLVWRCQVRAE